MTTGKVFNGYLNKISKYKKSKTVNNGGLLKMNTTKLLTLGLLIIGLFGLSGMATATVAIADGNDNVKFVGEALTLSWTATTNPYTYVWVTNDSFPTNTSAFCLGSYTAGALASDNSYLLNTSVNCTTAGVYYVIVNNTDASTSPTVSGSTTEKQFFYLNAFTVAVTPDYNSFGVFQGDNATVIIATSGPQSLSQRVGATFTVTSDSGATPVKVSADATSGNVTYKIPAGATAAINNVTVTNGAAKGTGKYAVRTFNIAAYDRTVSTNESNKVILQSLDANGAAANIENNVAFTLVISGLSDNKWESGSQTLTNVVFLAGTNTSIVSTKLATGATTGTATITATCANFTLSDAVNYSVTGADQNVTITATKLNGTATASFNIDQNVTIEGKINDNSAVNVNITNGTTRVFNKTVTPSAGVWTLTWDTATVPLFNTGAYTILAWKNGSVNNSENATATITLTDSVAITSATSTHGTTNLTDSVYADGTLTINGTSSRVNGKTVTVNVSKAGTWIATTTPIVTNGTWTTTWAATGITSTGAYTITAYDGTLVSATKAITVNNGIAITGPASGPINSVVAIRGTSTRNNGTVIMLSATDGIVSVMPAYANATVSGGAWSYNWSTTALTVWSYTVTANDSISTATSTITLDTGSLSGVAAAPASIFLDETVNITGASTFPAGTTVSVNITNCAGVTLYSTTTSVLSDQTFLMQWVPSTAWAAIAANTVISTGVPATLCAAANISDKRGTATFAIKDNLALTTVASVVTGEKVMLTGTSSRQNTTGITITVSLLNYAISRATTVSGGNFSEGTYYATITGLLGGTALPAGTYTINATDGVVSVVKTISVVTTGVLQITAPTQNQNISIGDNFMIIGTSNRASGTGVNISISGQNSTRLTATVNDMGIWNATWNTTGYAAGYFYINAQHVVSGALVDNLVTVPALLTMQTTTTTTTTSLGNGTTTTSTTLGSIPAHPTIAQVISAINLWAGNQMTITDLMIWIQRWASG